MLNKCQKLYLPVKQIHLKILHFKTSLFVRYEIWRSEGKIPEKKYVKREESVLTIKKDFSSEHGKRLKYNVFKNQSKIFYQDLVQL